MNILSFLNYSVPQFPTLYRIMRVSMVFQTVKNLYATQKTQVQSLGQEDSKEKGTATHSSIVAWRIPWTEESGGLESMGLQRARHDWETNTTRKKNLCLFPISATFSLFFPISFSFFGYIFVLFNCSFMFHSNLFFLVQFLIQSSLLIWFYIL